MEAVVVVDYLSVTVGAYRIRPDVGERGMTAASNPSLFRDSTHRLACPPM